MNKRLGIYFFFDEKGIVRDFAVEFVRGLKQVCDEVWIVINGEISDQSHSKLSEVESNIYVRENVGFDVWAYKSMMEKLGWDYVRSFSEVILCNFTCYGPIFPFSEMFDEMNDRACDFWGLIKHPEQPSYLLPNKKGYIYEHLMSYFIVVKEKLLLSEEFKKYWDNMPKIQTKRESTAYHETVFTKYFEDLGFISDSYIDLQKYKDRCYNSSIILANDLLIKDRCPLLKRRAFFFPEYEALLNISLADQVNGLMDYINKETCYDTNLIWQDLFETQKMSVLHNNMHLNFIVTSTQETNSNTEDVLYLVYIPETYYLDILMETITDLSINNNMILLCSDEKVKEYCEELNTQDRFIIRSVNINSNRIALSCLMGVQDEIKKYEYICAVFEYGVVEQPIRITEEDRVRYIYSCLIGNDCFKNNIISKFDDDKLGMLVPCESSFSVYYSQFIAKFQNNIKNIKKLCDELQINVPFDDDLFYGGEVAFIARRDLINKIIFFLEEEINYKAVSRYNIFNYMIPYLVQQNNYYIGTVISDVHAAIQINHSNFMKHKLIYENANNGGRFFWRFYDLLNDIKSKNNKPIVKTKYINVQPTRDEIVNTHFSLKEIGNILIKYPSHRKEYINNRKNKVVKINDYPTYTYLRNVSLENNRIILYFMCGNEKINDSYIEIDKKKFYSKKFLSDDKKELSKYVRDYSNAYVAFFEIPLDKVKNVCLKLNDKDGNQIHFKWASGISYNAIELSDVGLYTRISSEGYWIQDRTEYRKGVLNSTEYSADDKRLFKRLYNNKRHYVTLISENLSAADNSYELYKYIVDNNMQKNVYYLVSENVYNTFDDNKYKKNLVIFNSKKHKELLFYSARWIGSFSLRKELFPSDDEYKDIHYSLLPANWIFIPHGMAVGDKTVQMLYKYAWDNPRRTFVNSLLEAEAYEKIYGFKNVSYLGSPRMDKWHNARINENELFVFFTWRLGLSKGRNACCSSFEESCYFKTIVKLMNSIRNNFPNFEINYAFHHEIVKTGNDKILKKALDGLNLNFIYLNSMNGACEFDSHFASSKYLITDFSSVAYDFSYKPGAIPIYYLDDDFIKYHYILNDKFYDVHVGCVAKSFEEINEFLALKDNTEDMSGRRERFFGDIQGNNCKRVYEEIFRKTNDDLIQLPIAKKNEKRMSIYFFYDEQGIVDEYVFYYLEELLKVCQEVCVVINGKIEERYHTRLKAMVDKVLVRDNIGFDSSAYKYAIENYGYKYIAENFDELVLNNFTNFGPVYPFQEMFNYMDGVECDFWGHNRYHAHKNQRLDDVEMVDHLQSYFTVFRKSLLGSNDFKEYWDTLDTAKTYTEAVIVHEIRYTKFFEELGYISGEFIPFNAYDDNSFNSIMYFAYSQLTKYRSPFLKRKVFVVKDGKFEFPLREKETVQDLLDYVKKNTTYDVGLIRDNMIRTQGSYSPTSDEEKETIKMECKRMLEMDTSEVGMRKVHSMKNQIVSDSLISEYFTK